METVDVKDEILYAEFLEGNMESLEKIYKRYKESLVQYSKSIVQHEEIAEEIVQDIFLKICSNPEKYDAKYTVRSFLYMICHRKSLSYLKVTKRRYELNEQYFNEQEWFSKTDLSDEIARKEDIEVIKNAIKFLKLEYRVVLELTELQGLSTREASVILNRSENATKTLKCRAKSKLEEVIENKFSYTAKSYKKNLLQVIIICMCMFIVSATAVYAVIKTIGTVFKDIKTFTLNDYENEVQMKEDYITREQAANKMSDYLNVLGYNEEVKDICLFRDIRQCDDLWKYSDDNFEIRIDAYNGKLNKFFYRKSIVCCNSDIRSCFEIISYIEEILLNLGIEINIDNVSIRNNTMKSEFVNNVNIVNIDYKTVLYDIDDKTIIVKYSCHTNRIIDITVKSKSDLNGEILVSEKEAKDIVNRYYDFKEIISVELEQVEVNYGILFDYTENNKITNSKQFRNAWKVRLMQNDDKIIETYVDAITGEIIEINTKI